MIYIKDKEFKKIVKDILRNKEFKKLYNIEHHGISRYEHLVKIAYYSFIIAKKLKIDYNETQEKAIKSALNNNITIISGGPGTGKTTIINAIVKLYIEKEHNRITKTL